MAFGEWMVPKPSLAAEAQLRHSVATVRKTHPSDLASLIRLTERLLEQNMHYNTLLRQATFHIAEMEMKEALADGPGK